MRLAAEGRVQRALGVVLGVDALRLATSRLDRQTLKTAFRRQAHRLHPDKALVMGLSEQALTDRFRELKHAYDYLLALIEAQKATAYISEPAGPPLAQPGSDTRPGLHPSGKIPRRRLRFAQYLYYARVIDWNTLFRAMRWQHRTRPCVGEIARESGLLSRDDVTHILRHKRIDERFGEAALRLGRLDHVQLLTILGHQHRLDRPIGRYFVEHGVLTPETLEHWLRRHWTHNLAVATAEMHMRGTRRHAASGAAQRVAVR
jgi:hypothetical protein